MFLNNNVVDFLVEYSGFRNIREYEIDSGERINVVFSLIIESEILGFGFEYVRFIKNKFVIF